MQKSLSTTTAEALSIITHPVVIPFVVITAFVQLNSYTLEPRLTTLTFMVVAIGTFLLPLALVVFFMRMGAVKSLYMHEAKDRHIPFTMSSLSYYFTAKALQKLPLPQEVYLFFLGSALIIFLLMLALKWLKISAHLAGVGGLLATMAYLSHFGLLASIMVLFFAILAGITAWARLKLNAHTPLELVLGFSIGFICIFGFLNLGGSLT